MPQHDKYDNDILKQLTRIANSLEKIEKKLPDASNVYFCEEKDRSFEEKLSDLVNWRDTKNLSMGPPMRE